MKNEEKKCDNCLISKLGQERMTKTGNIMAGVSMECVSCSRNPFGGVLGEMLGPRSDKWASIPKRKKKVKKDGND